MGYKKFQELIDRHSTGIAIGCLLFCTALLLSQHWGMWLSNSDDPSILQHSLSETRRDAAEQGRFWLIPVYLMAQLPYAFGSWAIANAIKIAVNGAVLLSFTVFIARLVDTRTGLLAGLVWLAFIDVSPGYYSPFHGYLMMFNIEFAAMFTAFSWYIKKVRHHSDTGLIIGPYVLFAFAILAYEPMLFYAGIFPLITLVTQASDLLKPQEKFSDRLREWLIFARYWLSRNAMLIIVVGVYIGGYFLFRKIVEMPGRGIDFQGDWSSVLKTIYRFSVHGFRMDLSLTSNYVSGSTSTPFLLISLAYGLVVTFGIALLIPKIMWFENCSIGLRWCAVAICGFYVFIPNSLHGMVEGYRQWAAEDPHYVGNYFSSFALAPSVMLGLLFFLGAGKAYHEKALFGLVLYLVMASATNNQLRWMDMASANRSDAQLWERAIVDLRGKDWSALPKNPMLCAVNAPEKVSGDDRYFSRYLSERLGRDLRIKSKNLNGVICDVSIRFNDYRQL